MKKRVTLLMLCLITSSFGKTLVESEVKKENGQLIINLKAKKEKYVVKKGDTLKKISKKHRMTIRELVRRNKIEDPNLILEKQVIYVNKLKK